MPYVLSHLASSATHTSHCWLHKYVVSGGDLNNLFLKDALYHTQEKKKSINALKADHLILLRGMKQFCLSISSLLGSEGVTEIG